VLYRELCGKLPGSLDLLSLNYIMRPFKAMRSSLMVLRSAVNSVVSQSQGGKEARTMAPPLGPALQVCRQLGSRARSRAQDLHGEFESTLHSAAQSVSFTQEDCF